MSERIYIICHPTSGGGKGQQILEKVYQILDQYNLIYLIYLTDYSTHAHVITQQIIKKAFNQEKHRILVIGGDGTLHEVVSAIHQLGHQIPISYIPSGTGNDFHRTWQAGKNIQEIIDTMIFSKSATMIPVFTYQDHVKKISDIVLNSIGFGFDAEVNYQTQQISNKSFLRKFFDGKLAYLVSLIKSLNHLSPFDITLEVDGKRSEVKNVYLALFMNSPFVGGGIKADNLVEAEKAELSLILYTDINISAVLDLLPRVLIHQNQHLSEHTRRFTGQSISFKLDKAVRGQADGEDLSIIEADITLGLSSYPFYL